MNCSPTFSLLLLSTLVMGISCAGYPYKVGYFDQYVDHFNLMSYGDQTYKQKYLYQDKNWSKGVGPIFFYAGNEGPIEAFWDASGFIHEIAPEFGALVVFPEHRYYGDSLPFGNKSFQRPFLGLLTVEQAMADYAIFLSDLKTKFNATKSRIIAFGGSYGGMLAAYMRFKYPNIVHGSLAASAPIFMQLLDGPRNFFFSKVTQDFEDMNKTCDDVVRKAFVQMDILAKKGTSGLDQLSRYFNLCSNLSNQADYQHLLMWARNAFVMMAMLDYPYSTGFMGNLPGYPVKAACEALLNTSLPIDGLREAAGIFYNNSLKCFDIKAEFIPCADPTGCGIGPDAIAWDYQACTDIRLPGGSDYITDMFPVIPWTLEMKREYCNKTYGVIPRESVPGIEFLGKRIKATSNIIFSNGNLDPWMGGGVLKDISSTIIALPVIGGAHHLDLRAENKADPPGVVKARELERSIIRNWINEL